VLQPCRDGDPFVKAIPGCDWCAAAAGRDFLAAKGHWDWIVSTPPYSQFRAFLQGAMPLADNIVFVSLVGAWFVRSRQEDMRKAGFGLVELYEGPISTNRPQFGLTLAAGWARRGWQGSIGHYWIQKLFNAGRIRHHAPSFRKRLRIVAGRTAGKHFV